MTDRRPFAWLVYRVLLVLYPRDVRRACGEEMWHTFRSRTRESGHPVRRATLWILEWAGAIRHALPSRLAYRRSMSTSSNKEDVVRSFVTDLRYAMRGFLRAPATTVVILFTIALGIGASTAVFTVVKGVLLDPLPFPEADRLAAVWGRFVPESGFDFSEFPLSPPEYFDYREQTTVLQGLAAVSATSYTLTGEGEDAERLAAAGMTANALALLEVAPAIGRGFTEAEDVPSGPNIGLIGYDLWQRRYAADSAIIGRSIRLSGTAVEIIGVMPQGFGYPTGRTQVWVPIQLDPTFSDRTAHWLSAFGRLRPGATHDDMAAELEIIAQRWRETYPNIHTGHYLFAQPLIDNYVSNVRPALLALLGAVGIVMLIVCANVASVLLARGEHRQRELAVRVALGAGGSRLVRQLLTETTVSVVVGTILGIGIARAAVPALLGIGVDMPRGENIGLDLGVLAFTVAIAAICTLAIGVLPALQAMRIDVHGGLRDGARMATVGAGRLRFRRSLVVAQVALAVLLVIGAGLTVRSFERLLAVDRGFDASGVLVARLGLPPTVYDTAEEASRFWDDLVQRMRAHPAVIAATAATAIPIFNGMPNEDFTIDGRAAPRPGAPAHSGSVVWADPSFFSVTRIPLVRGRLFSAQDGPDAPLVTVINETMSRTFWPQGDALGQRIRWAGSEWVTVIGVVADARVDGLTEEIRPVRHVPLAQAAATGRQPLTMSVALKTSGDPTALAPFLRAGIAELDRNLVPTDVQSLDDVVDASVAQPRLLMTLMTLFAVVALSLGAVGIFGLMSFMVARRARDISIRMALGANRVRVAMAVLGQGVGLAMVGVVAGLALSVGGVQFIRGVLYDVSPYDPVSFALVPVVLLGAAAVACLIPAFRAMRLEVVEALRAE